jgi:adenylate kinase
MNLLIYGPPGSGKGTQAELLTKALDIPHVATGDILRGEVSAHTPLGQKAGPIMAAGGYVPDEVMIGIIRNRLQQADCQKGFIMDGFPRTIPQAEALDALMVELGRRFDRVLYMKVGTSELVKRLAGRMTCPIDQKAYPPGTEKCPVDGSILIQRDDDKPEAVKRRIEVYHEKTLPLLDYYMRQSLVSKIDGLGTIGEIHKRVLSALGQDAQVRNR